MRTKEQLERDKLVSKNLNKAMKTAFRLNKEAKARVYVYKQGTEFITCFEGEQGQYAGVYKFHAMIENGVIADEG